MLDGENLESVDVFVVESSGAGVNTPLTSVEGVREEREEKSHGGITTPSPPGPPLGSSVLSSKEDLRMTTVELQSESRVGGRFGRDVAILCIIRIPSLNAGQGDVSGE